MKDKLEIGTKVTVNLNAQAKTDLGINNLPTGVCTVSGHYPLGCYVRSSSGRDIAIADHYNAFTVIKLKTQSND